MKNRMSARDPEAATINRLQLLLDQFADEHKLADRIDKADCITLPSSSRRRAVLDAGAAWQVVDLSPSLPHTRLRRGWGPSLRGPTCSQVQP